MQPKYNTLFAGENKIKVNYGQYGFRRSGGNVHKGADVSTTGDATIRATAGGRVKWARCVAKGAAGWGSTWEWGWFVWIDAPDGTSHIYAHMQANSLRVKEGQMATAGQALGVMGDTGNAALDSQGRHVHYEVRRSGSAIDPTPWCGGENKAGVVWYGETKQEEKTMIPTFTVTGSLEVMTSPDARTTVPPNGGANTERWPLGEYAVYGTGTIAGAGVAGVKLRRGDGYAWAAKVPDRYAEGSVSLEDAGARGLLGGKTVVQGVEQARYDALAKELDAANMRLAVMGGYAGQVEAMGTSAAEIAAGMRKAGA